MERLFIRRFEPGDEDGVARVCFQTGYMGESLVGKNVFADSVLFAELFCIYYLRYEPQSCFVLFDSEQQRIAGYIIGSLDSSAQSVKMFFNMGWRIVLRILSITIWVHPQIIRTLITFLSAGLRQPMVQNLYKHYPAHLHINLLPEYQGRGFGKKLLITFEQYAKENGAAGIHLRTTDRNHSALLLYHKNGYSILEESAVSMWPDEKCKALLFGKRL